MFFLLFFLNHEIYFQAKTKCIEIFKISSNLYDVAMETAGAGLLTCQIFVQCMFFKSYKNHFIKLCNLMVVNAYFVYTVKSFIQCFY